MLAYLYYESPLFLVYPGKSRTRKRGNSPAMRRSENESAKLIRFRAADWPEPAPPHARPLNHCTERWGTYLAVRPRQHTRRACKITPTDYLRILTLHRATKWGRPPSPVLDRFDRQSLYLAPRKYAVRRLFYRPAELLLGRAIQ